MRAIVGIVCLLLGMGLVCCRVEGVAARQGAKPQAAVWVRTVAGWERTDTWQLPAAPPPRLHPLVVAAGQGLLSALGLAACRRANGAAAG